MDGRDIKPFRFDCTREGLDKFWTTVIASKNRFSCDEVIVGYDSTDPYAEPLVHYLSRKPVTVAQANPMHTKRELLLQCPVLSACKRQQPPTLTHGPRLPPEIPKMA
jgi:hypothetical protein